MRFVEGWMCVVVGVGAIACGQAEPGPAGYVLIDRDARAAGYALRNDDQVVSATLPVALKEGSESALIAANVERPLSAEPGELLYVRGAQAQTERWVIGRDLDPDAVDIDAPESAAQELASALGAGLVRRDSKWRLTAPDALHEASQTTAPGEVAGLEPVGIAPLAAAESALRVAPSGAGAASSAAELPVVDAALRDVTVGYPTGLTLQGVSCPGVAGTWRGRVYSEYHAGWYEFTLTVRQANPSSTALTGQVLAYSWLGPQEDPNPPKGCRGVERWKVKEIARGSMRADGTIEFDSQSWAVEQRLCVRAPTDYCLDHFVGKMVGGGTLLVAEAHDHCVVWSGLPIVLTRVSCQAT